MNHEIPIKDREVPTPEQFDKIRELKEEGYTWDVKKSISAAGVVFTKGEDLWFFGLDGSILQNPDGMNVDF